MTDKAAKLFTLKYFNHLAALVLASQTNWISKCEKHKNILKFMNFTVYLLNIFPWLMRKVSPKNTWKKNSRIGIKSVNFYQGVSFFYKIFTKNFLSWIHKDLIKVQINICGLFKYFLKTERITKSKYQNQTIVGFRQLKFLVCNKANDITNPNVQSSSTKPSQLLKWAPHFLLQLKISTTFTLMKHSNLLEK